MARGKGNLEWESSKDEKYAERWWTDHVTYSAKWEPISYKIIMTAGRVKKDMFTGLSKREAEEICEGYGWCVRPDGDGGFEWDLEIEEE